MKSSLHASYVAKGAVAEVQQGRESVFFVRNFPTCCCFYQSCSYGLSLSSHQAFDYAELWRDRSKDGLHVAAFSLQDSWSLGKLKLDKLIGFVCNLTFFLWIHKASPLSLRSKIKLQLISFLLGLKASASNVLFSVEYAKQIAWPWRFEMRLNLMRLTL